MLKNRNIATCCVILLMMAGLSQNASGQTVPSSADPLRQKSLRLEDRENLLRGLKNNPAPSPIPLSLPENLPNQSFMLNKVEIIGNTSLPQLTLEELYQSELGTQIDTKDSLSLLQSIQKVYFDKGFPFTRVHLDKVDFEQGVLTYKVIETYVVGVEVAADVPQNPMVTDFIKRLEGQALNTLALERYLLLLNDRQGVSLVSVISGVQKQDSDRGHVRILLKNGDIIPNPISGFIGFDNYGSNFTGPWITQAGVSFGNITPYWGELKLNTSFATSLPEMKRFGFSYNTPIYGLSGLELGLSGDVTRTEPGENLDELDIKGQSASFSLELSYPMIRQRDSNWWVQFGFTYKNSNTDITTDRLYDDRLRVLSLGTDYSFADVYNGLNAMSLTFDKGMDILGSRKTGSEDLSREEGRSNFGKINANVSRLQKLPYDIDILTSVSGQYTNTPLLSSEKFGFGGGVVGRGYDPSEITGDRGYSLSIEARTNYDIGNNGRAQPYAFFDFGKVWNIDQESKSVESGASAGIGARYFGGQNWTIDATLATPLTREVDNPPSYANGSSPRFLLRLNKNF